MIKRTPIQLSDEYVDVLNALERSSDHYFVTGRAGTGKSTLLQLFRNTTRKRIAVVAPTGIAALNVKGQTIHSFFGFPPRMVSEEEITVRRNKWLYRKLDTLIIDEISMVRADMLDNISRLLQVNRDDYRPFGGVQVIAFGDLFQLPPVIASPFERQYFREHYASPYFFSAKVFEEADFEMPMIELHQVYRQNERRFINLLDNIRQRYIDEDDFIELNDRCQPLPEDRRFYITLTSKNAAANAINAHELKQLDSPPFFFNAKVSGSFAEQVFPTAEELMLKVGAQVMFVKNDPEKRFVNGTIGTVSAIENNEVFVTLLDKYEEEYEIKVEKQEWEIIKYNYDPKTPYKINTEVVGTFSQIPLKLAWAITIHKSQGKTFDRVIIDMAGGAFEYGQTYVALSRCRTFEGIYLKHQLQPKDIMVDERITEYYEMKKRFG